MRKLLFMLFIIIFSFGYWTFFLLSTWPFPKLPDPFDSLLVFTSLGVLLLIYVLIIKRIKKQFFH